MTIPYAVVAYKEVEAGKTEVVVETKLPVVINGYGGGRITIVVENARLKEQIELALSRKFTGEVHPQKHVIDTLEGDLAKVQHLIEREEAVQEAEPVPEVVAEDEQEPESSLSESPITEDLLEAEPFIPSTSGLGEEEKAD